MKPLISPHAMRECERAYFESGAERSIDVMERAAQTVANAILSEIPEGSTLYFACGTGGNGGDGTACARILNDRYRCVIFQSEPPVAPDAIENLRRAKACGISVIAYSDKQFADFPCPAAWIDALFGTGLSRSPMGECAALIRRINIDRERGARVYAIDIPSGLHGGIGAAYPCCVHADHTIAIQYLKTGLILNDGLDLCGKVTVADVGFPANIFPSNAFDASLISHTDIARKWVHRPRNIYKNSCGHLLIIAGSFGMAGAAVMCAKAALRCGVGLVTIACVRSIVPILQMQVPQAMCIPLDETNGVISDAAVPDIESALHGKDAVVIGCGLSRKASPEAVRAILESELPAVIDADALNLLAEHESLKSLLKRQHFLTPHPGEAARLMDNLPSNPIEATRRLLALGANILYKGASTITAEDPHQLYVSMSGCKGMARGGSGDVLSGILGALLAGHVLPIHALTAALASEIHGLAGELAQKKYGAYGMNAADIIEFLPEVLPRD